METMYLKIRVLTKSLIKLRQAFNQRFLKNSTNKIAFLLFAYLLSHQPRLLYILHNRNGEIHRIVKIRKFCKAVMRVRITNRYA
mgnify:CR=1 FL=1